jgi:uncharacterized protein DUF4352
MLLQVAVGIRFTNNSNETRNLSQESLTLLDSANREAKPESDMSLYSSPDRMMLFERVNPGVTREGEAIFSVDPNASGFRVRAGDAQAFGSENVTIDLGF